MPANFKKPVFVAESTARGHYFDKERPEELWSGWFREFFQHIEKPIKMSSVRSPTSMPIGTVKTCGTDGAKLVSKRQSTSSAKVASKDG